MNAHLLVQILQSLMLLILIYYISLHALYMMLIMIGAKSLNRCYADIHFGDLERVEKSPLTLPISIIIPAHNEEKIIVETTLAALQLRYPTHEVIVVNDGSTDATMARMVERFQLHRVEKVVQQRLQSAPVTAVYHSESHPNLWLIEKPGIGRRADAINAGVNLASYPILCITDADSFFEEDALLRVSRPFLRDSKVVAASGVVRVANGLTVAAGRIKRFGLPRGMLPLVQEVEYLRSFLWARAGLAYLGSMMCMSGAFMVIRKDVFIELGGVDATTITDDIDFTVRLHKSLHEQRKGSRIEYLPDPVCFTEVPETMEIYAAQRNRWQRGTLQALLRQWRMTFNPRYGMAGMFGMPFFLLFEAASAPIELAGWIIGALLVALGVVSLRDAGLALLLAFTLTAAVSASAILLMERSRRSVNETRDLWRLYLACIVENFGYHQLHMLFRVTGTFQYLVRRRNDLGKMMRYGSFQQPAR